MSFATRHELPGTFGVVATAHWIASGAGLKFQEADRTASNYAVGMDLMPNVVEPHLNGPLVGMASIACVPPMYLSRPQMRR